MPNMRLTPRGVLKRELADASSTESALGLYTRYRTRVAKLAGFARTFRMLGPLCLSMIGLFLLVGIAALANDFSVPERGIRGTFEGVPVTVYLPKEPTAFSMPITFASIASGAALALAFGIGMGANFLGVPASRRLRLARQHYLDLFAADVMASLRNGEPTPVYTLYLRPFLTTGEFRQTSTLEILKRANINGGGFEDPLAFASELEAVVAAAVEDSAPLIGLGNPFEHAGAGRIRVADDEWQAAVALLATHARLIVLSPSVRPGTRWEVSHVLERQLLPRTVVVNLPTKKIGKKRYDQATEWSDLSGTFAAHCIDLPPAEKTGRFLFFGTAPKVQLSASFKLLKLDDLRAFFDRVLREV
jgi:hypothetical protein